MTPDPLPLPEPWAYLSRKDGFCNAANSTTFRWFCEGNRDGWHRGWPDGAELLYTAEQMHAYAAQVAGAGREDGWAELVSAANEAHALLAVIDHPMPAVELALACALDRIAATVADAEKGECDG